MTLKRTNSKLLCVDAVGAHVVVAGAKDKVIKVAKVGGGT